MRAPTILRSLPFRPRKPAAVTPLPENTRFDRQLTAELRAQGTNYDSDEVIGLLDAAISTQKIALDSLKINSHSHIDEADRGAIDKYLEDNTEILDACNYLVDKMERLNEYVESLRVVVHLVDRGNEVASTRALELLESCQRSMMGKRGNARENRGFCLKKMLRQKLCHETELGEVMCGSKAMALMSFMFLELSLSFDSSKKGDQWPLMKLSQPTGSCWVRLLQEKASEKKNTRGGLLMAELKQTVIAARELKDLMKGKREKEMKYGVEMLKICCKELEHRLVMAEERVKSLYKSLIDVRMALLGILSQPASV